eukprot:3999917-Prymnesium_polylepis.1
MMMMMTSDTTLHMHRLAAHSSLLTIWSMLSRTVIASVTLSPSSASQQVAVISSRMCYVKNNPNCRTLKDGAQ